MKKPQSLKLWRELHNSTDKEGVYSKLNNKRGYGGRRTLIRYAQLDDGLRQGLPLEELAKSTGWSESFLAKVAQWWKEEFGGKSPTNGAKGASSPEILPPANSPWENAQRWQKHCAMLLAPLDTLTGIEPFPHFNPT